MVGKEQIAGIDGPGPRVCTPPAGMTVCQALHSLATVIHHPGERALTHGDVRGQLGGRVAVRRFPIAVVFVTTAVEIGGQVLTLGAVVLKDRCLIATEFELLLWLGHGASPP